MKITLIAAVAENGAIGKNNQLLWHLPADLKFFKQTTLGKPVVMGRRTFESVGKPLPGRRNIVISTNPDWKAEGVERVSSLPEAMEMLKDEELVFIVGGEQVYRTAMPLADELIITHVAAAPEADTFFPEISPENWRIAREMFVEKDEKNAFSMRFVWYLKLL
jgi:dihydrofolate reductase